MALCYVPCCFTAVLWTLVTLMLFVPRLSWFFIYSHDCNAVRSFIDIGNLGEYHLLCRSRLSGCHSKVRYKFKMNILTTSDWTVLSTNIPSLRYDTREVTSTINFTAKTSTVQ